MRYSCFLFLFTAFLACNSPTPENVRTDSVTTDTTSRSSAYIATDTAQQVHPDRLISPGKGIGHLSIGEATSGAIAALGTPDFSDAAMGSSLMTWYSHHDTSGYRTSVFANRAMGTADEDLARIRRILVTSPWFRTPEGLGVGSPQAAFDDVYDLGEPQNITVKGRETLVYTDKARGISFEVDKQKKNCVGVIVQAAGSEGMSYINMHE